VALPSIVEPVKFVAGDALTIKFFWIGLDLSDYTFVSHIRRTVNDTEFTPFTITCYYDQPTNTTWLILSLTGDTAVGAMDGETRDIPLEAVYDVEGSLSGQKSPTFFSGTLDGRMDVTR
jgi:hypothetical protein